MNDEQFFLASAYLDGELTATERDIAEADPAVMAEVERLRAVQTQLASVEPPAPSVRAAAVSAAMREFGRAAAPAPNRVQFGSRPVARRVLAVAAAVVAVGALGIVIVDIGSGGDDDDSNDSADVSESRLTEADTATASADEAESTELAPADEQLAAPVPAGDDSAAADDAAGSDVPEEATTDAESAEAALDMADDGVTAEAGSDVAAAAVDLESLIDSFAVDPGRSLTGEEDVTAYGMYLLDMEDAGELPSTPNTHCTSPDHDASVSILAATTYESPDGPTDVLVAVDSDTGQGWILDPDTCEVLVTGVDPATAGVDR